MKDRSLFVFRNYTVEALFKSFPNAAFGDYDSVDFDKEGQDIFVWMYLVPVRSSTNEIQAEIENISTKLQLTINSVKDLGKTMVIFTMENLEPFQWTSGDHSIKNAVAGYNSMLSNLETDHDFIKVLDISSFT